MASLAQHTYRVPRGAPGISRWRTSGRIYIAAALGYLLLLPPQLTAAIGSSQIAPYRFLLIPAALYVAACYLRGRVRFNAIDGLVLVATFWIGASLLVTTELTEAFTAIVAQTTDIALSYFFARVIFRSENDIRAFLVLMVPGFALIALAIGLEAAVGKFIVQDFFSELTGRGVDLETKYRLGFMRAAGPFPHPILAGMFFATLLPLYLMSGIRNWPKWFGVALSFGAFFSFSSAAFLGFFANAGLITYDWICERLENVTWRLFLFLLGTAVLALELGTSSGTFGLLARYAALDWTTAFYRSLIWEYGSASVAANPWFGIGYADYVRPDWMPTRSVDNYWLGLAMQFGIVPPVLVALATALAVFQVAKSALSGALADRRFRRGISIAIAVFALGLISVSIWLSAQVWYYMLVGMAATLAHSGKAAEAPRMMMTPPARRAAPYRGRPALPAR